MSKYDPAPDMENEVDIDSSMTDEAAVAIGRAWMKETGERTVWVYYRDPNMIRSSVHIDGDKITWTRIT